MKLISVILSFRNEESTIPEMVARLESTLSSIPEDYEIIFVNDASTDRSLELLNECHARNSRVKVITLSRRFGVEPAIFAGLFYCRGDAVVTIDADLQDPPELIPELVQRWRQGADVVYTVRQVREGEHWLKLLLTNFGYRLIQGMADIHIPLNAGDFRLVSRRVVNVLLELREPNTYLRGLVQWVGFKREPFQYTRAPRAAGTSHFGAFSRGPIATLFYGITGFSALPIYGIVACGGLVLCISSVALVAIAVDVALGGTPTQTALIILAMVWLWAGLMAAIGIVGLYVTRAFRNTLGRPRYLIESTLGLTESPATKPPSGNFSEASLRPK